MMKRMAAAVALLPLTFGATSGTALAHAPAEAKPAAQVITLTYYAGQADGKWADAIKNSTEVWNESAVNVHLQPADSPESADFVYTSSDGWPHATLGPIKPGGQKGEVELGQQAVDEGHDINRIVAHETGHILGLDDHYEGPCSELMSGHGPGTSCTNDTPDEQERGQVEENYASGVSSARPERPRVVVDPWHARTPALAG